MELEGWWRVGEGWRVGAAENKTGGREGFGKAQVDTAEYAGLEGWRARPRAGRAGWHPNLLILGAKKGWRAREFGPKPWIAQ